MKSLSPEAHSPVLAAPPFLPHFCPPKKSNLACFADDFGRGNNCNLKKRHRGNTRGEGEGSEDEAVPCFFLSRVIKRCEVETIQCDDFSSNKYESTKATPLPKVQNTQQTPQKPSVWRVTSSDLRVFIPRPSLPLSSGRKSLGSLLMLDIINSSPCHTGL